MQVMAILLHFCDTACYLSLVSCIFKSMSYFRHHVFFCTNLRDDDSFCCEKIGNAQAMRDYVKSSIKQKGLAGKGGVRVNTAGCLDRCGDGPVLVVYPDETWYHYQSETDIDEIIEQHLINGKKVQRLLLD